MTQNDINKLTSAQNKYLKWMLHTPRGTCNSFALLELGLLPIVHEISQRKLNFLHHILNLPTDDPVRIAYNEQKPYTNEPNWYNEICTLIKEYGLELDEETIRNMSREKWKEITSSAIHKTVLESLYKDCISKSKTANLPRYPSLSQQDYFQYLSPKRARMFFQLRAGVYDIKCNRSYMYNDEECRLCSNQKEDADHVLNQCSEISRDTTSFDSMFGLTEGEAGKLLDRVEQFRSALDKKEKRQNQIPSSRGR